MDYNKVRITKKITVWGIVQGVGFRPLVFHLAQKHHIFGSVRNLGGMVEIIVQAYSQDFERFLEELKQNSGDGYEIMWLEVTDLEDEGDFSEFYIEESGRDEDCVILPPDLPVCPTCQEELEDKRNRRFHNPFISCMSCGPRYTIMEELPYDRQNTTMRDFHMCDRCKEEYTSPESRRFHAQTISCNDCGPYLIYRCGKDREVNKQELNKQELNKQELNKQELNKQELNKQEMNNQDSNKQASIKQESSKQELINQEALEEAIGKIQAGGIVAMKGIGGYHLVCSPFIEETVENLRKLKGREEKPFAVMFETVESMEEYCLVSKEEREMLESKAKPIVLLAWRNQNNTVMTPSTFKGSIYCGAFLPYTPLQILLIKRCGPLIMTSANLSNQPIIKEDSIMLTVESPYLDGVLYNYRRIIRSVDDSVAKLIDHKPQLIRRSRGYVPYPVFFRQGNSKMQILAMGGDLKAAFCLYKKGAAVVSQYFGDLEEGTVYQEYQDSISDLSRFLKMKPDKVVCDLHPNYHSTTYAKTLGVPVLQVQHHHAHIAAVIAEHNIKEPVIGIAFDGTGYGTDGNVWGGEFLLCEGADYKRIAHLKYTPMLGGDQGMRDAKKTATCYLIHHELGEYCNDKRKDMIEAAVKNNINTILSSSMGRLFDAVASLLGIQEKNQYEGQCAIMLENAAVMALRRECSVEKLIKVEDIKCYDEVENAIKIESVVDISKGEALEKEELTYIDDITCLKELAFSIEQEENMLLIDSKPILETICKLRNEVSVNALALGFHYALADVIVTLCDIFKNKHGVNTVALGGGVFQNTLLLERVLKLLREQGFDVYYNEVVPPNDGSISLGQAYLGQMR